MAITIDSLVVTLGLDPKNFTQGQREAMAAYKRMVDDAKRQSKNLEEEARRSSQVISRVRNEAIGLFAGLAGAAGIKQFVSNLVSGDLALSAIARSTGVSASEIAKWQGAAKIAGGTAEGMAQAFTGLKEQIFEFQTSGQSRLIIFYQAIAAEGGHALDISMSFDKQLMQLAKNLEVIDKKRPGEGSFWLNKIGMGGAEPLLNRGDKFLKDTLATTKAIGHATDEDAEAAKRFWAAWEKSAQTVTNTLRRIFYEAATHHLDSFNDFIKRYREWIKTDHTPAWIKWTRQWTERGAPPIAPGTPTTTPSGTPSAKADVGKFTSTTRALANLVSGIPGFKEITAADDAFHGGAGAHGAGRAIDFTIADESQYAATAERLRKILNDLRINATVIDEKNHPSPGATGPHIHVSVPRDPMTLSRLQAAGHTEININQVNLTVPAGMDGKGIASDFVAELQARRLSTASAANNGVR